MQVTNSSHKLERKRHMRKGWELVVPVFLFSYCGRNYRNMVDITGAILVKFCRRMLNGSWPIEVIKYSKKIRCCR